MARQFKVFAVSFLLACLFAFPAHAEFSSSDSLNLSNIRSDVSTIRTYISNLSDLGIIKSYLNSISSNIISYFDPSRYGSFSNSALSSLNSISSQLSSILSALGHTDSSRPDYSQMYLAFDTSYYSSASVDPNYPFMVASNGNFVDFYYKNAPLVYYLEPGKYLLVVNLSSSGSSGYLAFGQPFGGHFDFDNADFSSDLLNLFRYGFTFEVPDGGTYFTDGGVYLPVSSYYCSAYLYKVDGNESLIYDQFEDSFENINSSLSEGVSGLENLENSAFESLDTSIGSLDFSGSALGQVVSGFTFIRAVFSAIYSSSPYISVLINLSCMLGVLALFLRIQPRFTRWEREHRDRST